MIVGTLEITNATTTTGASSGPILLVKDILAGRNRVKREYETERVNVTQIVGCPNRTSCEVSKIPSV